MEKHYDQPGYSERKDRDYTSNEVLERAGTPWFKKLSWGSIFAGLLVSLVSMLLLNLLGLGIGLSTINPVTEQDPMSGIGTGAIIWWVLSNLIAIFAGGYVAARTAGIPLGFISTIHGILTWCAYTLVSFWLLTTVVGGIISGVGSVISTTVSAVGSGIEAVADGSGSQQQNQQTSQNQSQSSISLGQIMSEVQKILRQTGDPALQPDSIKRRAQQNLQDIKQTVRTEENLSNQEVQDIGEQILNMTQNLTQEIDREDVVNVITERTDLSEQTVNNMADVVVRNVQKAQQEVKQLAAQAEEKAEEAAQKAADAISKAAIWSFFALLLGLGAAFAGGKAGTPKHDVIH